MVFILVGIVLVVYACWKTRTKKKCYKPKRINEYVTECDSVNPACARQIKRYTSVRGEPSLHLVSCGTDEERSKPLVRSAHRHNLHLHLGCTEISDWCGFGEKFQFIDRYLRTHEAADDDILVLIDAYDVVFLNTTEQEIISRIQSLKKPLFTSAGLYQWPARDGTTIEEDWKQAHQHLKSPYKFPCTGITGGRVKELRALVEEALSLGCEIDDQAFWQDYYLKNPSLVAIDYDSIVSVSTGQEQERILWSPTQDRVLVKPTGGTPPILHVECNNGGKKDWHAIVKYLDAKYPAK